MRLTYLVLILALFSSCAHQTSQTRAPAADSNTYTITQLTTLPDKVMIEGKTYALKNQAAEIFENMLDQYAPDTWNTSLWLNHYYRTNPKILQGIAEKKLNSPNPIFAHIKTFADDKLQKPELRSAISNYTSSSNALNRALWKKQQFVLDSPNLTAKDLGADPQDFNAAINLKKAIAILKNPEAKEPWVLFRGTAMKLPHLYNLIQQETKGQPIVYPHYGYASYSADKIVPLRFTRADIVGNSEIKKILQIMKNSDIKKVQSEIQSLGYNWDESKVATLIVRLTTQSMAILFDSWSSVPGELEAIQPPENILVKEYFSLADHCRTFDGKPIPGMQEHVETIISAGTIPEIVDKTGLLVLMTGDMGATRQAKFDLNSMKELCANRAQIVPQN